MIAADEARRLAFVKYLLSLAGSHLKQPEPLACAALLMFHDATELFLQLASEHLDVGKPNLSFMEYWDLISPKLSPDGLPQRESLRRMNKARVALKHYGMMPSRLDLDNFAVSVSRFFEQSTPLVFGVALDSISLLDFIASQSVRAALQRANAGLDAGDLQTGFAGCAEAFDELIRDYEDRKRGRFGRSPFFFGESMTFLSASHIGLDQDESDRRLGEFVDKVKQSVEALQEAMKVLSLGLDFRRYARFQLLTPMVVRMGNGNRRVYGWPTDRGAEVSRRDLSFCIDFVIESALRLQEFDFDWQDSRLGRAVT
ncbi:MAG: hypothetical protein ACREKF_15530 [Candidatus Methylomirabilales bacterium]